jgi:hypothetical protein
VRGSSSPPPVVPLPHDRTGTVPPPPPPRISPPPRIPRWLCAGVLSGSCAMAAATLLLGSAAALSRPGFAATALFASQWRRRQERAHTGTHPPPHSLPALVTVVVIVRFAPPSNLTAIPALSRLDCRNPRPTVYGRGESLSFRRMLSSTLRADHRPSIRVRVVHGRGKSLLFRRNPSRSASHPRSLSPWKERIPLVSPHALLRPPPGSPPLDPRPRWDSS